VVPLVITFQLEKNKMAAFPEFDLVPQTKNLTVQYLTGDAVANAYQQVLTALKRTGGTAFDMTNAVSMAGTISWPALIGQSAITGPMAMTSSAPGVGTITFSQTQGDIEAEGPATLSLKQTGSYQINATDGSGNIVLVQTGTIAWQPLP
jgi:hypothetical protein